MELSPICKKEDRHLCPRLRPAQLLCRGAGLPLYGTWLPCAAHLAAALSQSAGGAGGGAAGSYGTQRPAAATAAGFLCQKRLSPLQLAGPAVQRGTGCAHARRAGTGFCRLSRVLSPDLWPFGAPFCAKAPIKRRRAKFSLYFGRGWCRIVADFQIQ